MTSEDWKNFNIDVVVRCGYCGRLLCFYPHRVKYLGECKCGNDNWGSPSRDWPRGSFGDFDLILTNQFPLPELFSTLGFPNLGGVCEA